MIMEKTTIMMDNNRIASNGKNSIDCDLFVVENLAFPRPFRHDGLCVD